jgi:hypothetical protein
LTDKSTGKKSEYLPASGTATFTDSDTTTTINISQEAFNEAQASFFANTVKATDIGTLRSSLAGSADDQSSHNNTSQGSAQDNNSNTNNNKLNALMGAGVKDESSNKKQKSS